MRILKSNRQSTAEKNKRESENAGEAFAPEFVLRYSHERKIKPSFEAGGVDLLFDIEIPNEKICPDRYDESRRYHIQVY